MLVLGFIGIPLELGLLWTGIRFVMRNKVDVPTSKKTKKNKKKKQKAKESSHPKPKTHHDYEPINIGFSINYTDQDTLTSQVYSDEELELNKTSSWGKKKKVKQKNNGLKIGIG